MNGLAGNIIEKARSRQYQLDECFKKWNKKVSGIVFFQFLFFIFTIMGLGLFLFCIICDINFLLVDILSNPLLFLGLGMICFCFFYGFKKGWLQ